MEWVEEKVLACHRVSGIQDLYWVLFLFIYNPIRHDLLKTFHKVNYLLRHNIPF